MFGIYTFKVWTCLPISDPINIGYGLPFENTPVAKFDNINDAIETLQKEYSDKIYKIPCNDGFRDGIEFFVSYILDSNADILASLDFDGTLQLSEKGREYIDNARSY